MLLTVSALAAVAAWLEFWMAAASGSFADGPGVRQGFAFGVPMTALSALLLCLAALS
jgi:hypothetical protein